MSFLSFGIQTNSSNESDDRRRKCRLGLKILEQPNLLNEGRSSREVEETKSDFYHSLNVIASFQSVGLLPKIVQPRRAQEEEESVWENGKDA